MIKKRISILSLLFLILVGTVSCASIKTYFEEREKWGRAGFNYDCESINVTCASSWINAGFTPEEAKKWSWREGGFHLGDTAQQWRDAGFINPKKAKKWKSRGFAPAEVKTWQNAGFSLYSAGDWKRAEFSPIKAKSWLPTGIRPHNVNRWETAEFSPSEAKDWNHIKFVPALAREWKEQGVVPLEAKEWHRFKFNSIQAKEWKDAGLSAKEAHQAEIFKLDIQDVTMKGKEGNITIPPLWAALCKANNISNKDLASKMVSLQKCKDQRKLFLSSPYEILDEYYDFQVKLFQLIDKSRGLYKITIGPNKGENIFLDFEDGIAPIIDITGIAKGVDPLEYKAVLGNKKVVHSFKILWFLKIPPDLKKKMIKLELW